MITVKNIKNIGKTIMQGNVATKLASFTTEQLQNTVGRYRRRGMPRLPLFLFATYWALGMLVIQYVISCERNATYLGTWNLFLQNIGKDAAHVAFNLFPLACFAWPVVWFGYIISSCIGYLVAISDPDVCRGLRYMQQELERRSALLKQAQEEYEVECASEASHYDTTYHLQQIQQAEEHIPLTIELFKEKKSQMKKDIAAKYGVDVALITEPNPGTGDTVQE